MQHASQVLWRGKGNHGTIQMAFKMVPGAQWIETTSLASLNQLLVKLRHGRKSAPFPLFPGGFNRSAQHLLILRGEEVCHDDVADLVHGSAEGELWERWKNGQSAAAISRALARKNKTGGERIVVLHGGIVPAPRRRTLAALRLEEREEISRGIVVGRSIR